LSGVWHVMVFYSKWSNAMIVVVVVGSGHMSCSTATTNVVCSEACLQQQRHHFTDLVSAQMLCVSML
jgi:hypothetical protein